MTPFVDFRNVSKIYKTGEVETPALQDVSFSVDKGEFCVIVGPSGAGKTTILNILGGMDSPTHGEIEIDNQLISSFTQKELTSYRRFDVGFVFQFYNLIQNLTARENVELASEISRDPFDADWVLQEVGLSHRADNFPAQLSGGEQQRVAIARALAKNPKILLCDEPTGALDDNTGKQILKLLQETCQNIGTTVILITHNSVITQMAQRVIKVKNGHISSVRFNDDPLPAEAIEW